MTILNIALVKNAGLYIAVRLVCHEYKIINSGENSTICLVCLFPGTAVHVLSRGGVHAVVCSLQSPFPIS